jgi:hypothetical protein
MISENYEKEIRMTDNTQSDRDAQDVLFIEEMNKRIAAKTSRTKKVPNIKNLRIIVKEVLDSMIIDKIIGPSFHQEVDTFVSIDKVTKEIDITIRLIHPERDL